MPTHYHVCTIQKVVQSRGCGHRYTQAVCFIWYTSHIHFYTHTVVDDTHTHADPHVYNARTQVISNCLEEATLYSCQNFMPTQNIPPDPIGIHCHPAS